MSRLAVLATVYGLLWCPGDLAAQNLVITNARIIIGTGSVIERGSIVVRGRIASVAAGDLGTLESGKLADIAPVDGDPLDLIYNLLNVKVVVKGGTVVVDKR
jgi:hypothetical protein